MRLEDTLRDEERSRFLVAGELVLDRADHRAWLASAPLDLGSKAFALLAELMQHPQRLVTKDRLFDVGWPDQAVSDAVLTTAIRELRRALGDPARSPEWIETQHGKGYRFLKDVEPRAVHPGRQKDARPTVNPATEPAGGSRFPLRWLWLALPVLLALGGALWWQERRDDAAAEATRNHANADHIAVLPFTVDGGEPWMGSAVSSRLTDVLSNAPGIFVADSESALAIAEAEDAESVARLNDIGTTVSGNVSVDGETVAIELRIAAVGGEEIWSRQLSDDQANFIPLTERAALETARVLAIAADPDNLAEMARIGTGSIAAFEEYSRAHAILDSLEGFRDPRNVERAIAHLHEAVAADPNFGRAAATLAWFSVPSPYDPDASASESRSLALLQIAAENAPNDVERRSYEATIDMRRLHFADAVRKLRPLYQQTSRTSSDLNHSILTMLGYIAMATRDRELGEWAWREVTEFNVARGRVQMKHPFIVAHRPTELEQFAQLHAQLDPTPTGLLLQHEALLLLGWTRQAAQLVDREKTTLRGTTGMLVKVSQACAEGRAGDARAMVRGELGASPTPSYPSWQLAQVAGLIDLADRLQPPARSPAAQRALLMMMQDPGFDASPYPLLVAALRDAGVDDLRVPRPAYYCPSERDQR